jgi:hypothetical protein
MLTHLKWVLPTTYHSSCRAGNDLKVFCVNHGLLEKEFNAQLNEARRIGVHDLPKRETADIAVDGLGPEELCVVKNVKTFQPKLEGFRFA